MGITNLEKERQNRALRLEVEALRKYRTETEHVLHLFYDQLYFDPTTKCYDPNKEWDSAGEFMEFVARYMQRLMGKPPAGTKVWPPIAGLPSAEKP